MKKSTYFILLVALLFLCYGIFQLPMWLVKSFLGVCASIFVVLYAIRNELK